MLDDAIIGFDHFCSGGNVRPLQKVLKVAARISVNVKPPRTAIIVGDQIHSYTLVIN
jgi:hypothetical protein